MDKYDWDRLNHLQLRRESARAQLHGHLRPCFCRFSPFLGPLVFSQSDPFPEMTLMKLLLEDRQTTVACQGHDVDSIATSFSAGGDPEAKVQTAADGILAR